MTECPNCGKNIASMSSSGEQQVLCTLNNEGGVQDNLDLMPRLTEETYLKAYPEDRKCRAFLEFCREGDYKAIIDMLQNDEVDEDDEDEEMGDSDEQQMLVRDLVACRLRKLLASARALRDAIIHRPAAATAEGEADPAFASDIACELGLTPQLVCFDESVSQLQACQERV